MFIVLVSYFSDSIYFFLSIFFTARSLFYLGCSQPARDTRRRAAGRGARAALLLSRGTSSTESESTRICMCSGWVSMWVSASICVNLLAASACWNLHLALELQSSKKELISIWRIFHVDKVLILLLLLFIY